MVFTDLNTMQESQRGATLIEILITVVIISLGLLAVAAQQAVALKTNNGSYLRSQATFLAYDLADRIRAAPDSALNGSYDDGSSHPDRQQWDLRVSALLGTGASGQVVRNSREVAITLIWNDSRARIRGSNDTDLSGPASFIYRMEF